MQKIAEQQKQIACNTQQGYNEGDDFKAVRSMPRALYVKRSANSILIVGLRRRILLDT